MPTTSEHPENVGDRLVLLEVAVAYLVERQEEVGNLTAATKRLTDATMSVETALRTVGEVRQRQEQLARTVTQVSRHLPGRKRFALLVVCLALLASIAAYGIWDRVRVHDEIKQIQTCEQKGVCYPNAPDLRRSV